MAVRKELRDYILEQLGRVTPVRAKAMFGGYGIYAGEHFFALLAGESLYLKADDINRPDFEKLGSRIFQPYAEGMSLPYFEFPLDMLEDTHELRPYVEGSIDAARRKPKKKKRK
jgi:DNA transformation protein and related proteins